MESENKSLGQTMRESILILIFELIGTALLTLLYSCLGSTGDAWGFYLGIFILILFSARISGSHFNPAVTLAFIFRKDTGRFSRVLGISYIIFQVGGAFCGSFLFLLFSQSGGNV